MIHPLKYKVASNKIQIMKESLKDTVVVCNLNRYEHFKSSLHPLHKRHCHFLVFKYYTGDQVGTKTHTNVLMIQSQPQPQPPSPLSFSYYMK